jgi:SAM-dependent methyltransferase
MSAMARHDQETYWSKVAAEVRRRPQDRLVAGYENPYLRYKRSRFLDRFLDSIDFAGRTVLELGPGPGGNLRHILEHHRPGRILGADISETMCELALENLSEFGDRVEIRKIDGRLLPFADLSVDLSFTATVLQHVTDESMFRSIVSELCRVTRNEIVVMEDIGPSTRVGGKGSYVGRTVDVYQTALAHHGFALGEVRFLGTLASRWWSVPILRLYRALNRRHHEGEPIPALLTGAMRAPFPVTRHLDEVLPDRWDLAKMVFRRQRAAVN